MEQPLLEVSGLGKRFGGFVALESIDLSVRTGERLGLIGPNGSGKSTLVNCLCGTLRHDSGSVVFDGRPIDSLPAYRRTRLGLARSFQLPKPFRTLNLVDNLRIPLLYTVNARPGARLSNGAIGERCRALLADVGLADKAVALVYERVLHARGDVAIAEGILLQHFDCGEEHCGILQRRALLLQVGEVAEPYSVFRDQYIQRDEILQKRRRAQRLLVPV